MNATWETFLRIESFSMRVEAPPLDEQWMLQRGIDTTSPAVLRHLRDDVLPLVTRLSEEGSLHQFSFLVHAYPLVPTTAEDVALYIHLRLDFLDERHDVEIMRKLPPAWHMTRCWDKGEIAGVDSDVLDIEKRWLLHAQQSEWMLDFVRAHKDADLGVMVKHARQYLHFFANMAQMRVA